MDSTLTSHKAHEAFFHLNHYQVTIYKEKRIAEFWVF